MNIGEYHTAQRYGHECRLLVQSSANLIQEARALSIETTCAMQFGDYKDSTSQLLTAREFLGLCGMSGGVLDHMLRRTQAEAHLMTSEYVEARRIHTEIVNTTSADQHIQSYAYALLNIAAIDVIIGATEDEVHQNLDRARTMFYNVNQKYTTDVIFCDLILADLELRERNFSRAQCMLRLGDLANEQGDLSRAYELWKADEGSIEGLEDIVAEDVGGDILAVGA
ncbi:hypothetical protein B0H13DRAFT_1887763 [Mycena leptocephala]|nr:hypothetical protein B0H13DRAFT_1887763 [Mycena leptocephala]